MEEFFWDNNSWAFKNWENIANSDKNPEKNLLEAINSALLSPQTAESEPLAVTVTATARNKRKQNEIKTSGGDDQRNEQERTEKQSENVMQTLNDDLQSSVPQLPPKLGKTTANQKLTSPPALSQFPANFQTWISDNVILSVTGDIGHINVCCEKINIGLLTAICSMLEKHKLDLVSLNVSTDQQQRMYMIQARANGDVVNTFSTVELFQQAAAEIMAYINSLY